MKLIIKNSKEKIQTNKLNYQNIKNNKVIETTKLSKYFDNGSIKAVDNLDLTIYEGETFGLLGPNGAGKTTTVRLLNCLMKPSGGTAEIGGYSIKNPDKVKTITGLLAETPALFEKLSAYEFIHFIGALYDVPKMVLKDRIEELLKLLGIYDRRDHYLEGFSQGMKQKVLIASALIHDPPIFFFDEPTAGLDPRAAHIVKILIKNLSEQAGKTVIVCSHVLPLVQEICDRIGIIYEGKLIAVGTVEEIITQSGKKTLEEAFIALTGGDEEIDLMAWRKG